MQLLEAILVFLRPHPSVRPHSAAAGAGALGRSAQIAVWSFELVGQLEGQTNLWSLPRHCIRRVETLAQKTFSGGGLTV